MFVVLSPDLVKKSWPSKIDVAFLLEGYKWWFRLDYTEMHSDWHTQIYRGIAWRDGKKIDHRIQINLSANQNAYIFLDKRKDP